MAGVTVGSGAAVQQRPPVTVADLVVARATRAPDAVAVECGGVRFSYDELVGRARRLAARLAEDGIGPESVVGLHLPASADFVVATFGVMLAGAAFLPLDLASPRHRVAAMIDDADVAAVLVADDSLAGLCRTIRVDEVPRVVPATASNPPGPAHPQSLVAVFYTSGTTGGPKGVTFTHRELTKFTLAMVDAFALRDTDRILQLAPIGFDVVLEEILPTLAAGGTVVVPAEPLLATGADLTDYLDRHRITGFEVTAPYWQEWVRMHDRSERPLPATLRFVAMGGERVAAENVAAWARMGRPLVHVYGLTEATVTSTVFHLRPGDPVGGALPIGRPLPNVRVHVLDDRLAPVPTGSFGELYVSGGLARGYHKRPAITAGRFLPSPFDEPGARMYRTGDLVRRRPDGNLEFAGRVDQQVKVRGFRVELGEVEAAIDSHPSITCSLATVREDRPGDRRLVAYVQVQPGRDVPAPAALREHIAERLPGYMVPTAIVRLAEFPLTSSGKYDRSALPPPAPHTAAPEEHPEEHPGEGLLPAIRAIVADVLGVEHVGSRDNFFDLGGHSMLAIRLVSRLRSDLGVELTVRKIFDDPTPAGFTRAAAAAESSGGDFDVLLPLRTDGETTPLFCVHPVTGLSWCYGGLAEHLDPAWAVYGLQARGISQPGNLPGTVEAIVTDYVAEMRRVQPTGPYHLLGWSLGGNIAHAMAAHVHSAGEEVVRLILLDSYPPDLWDAFAHDGTSEDEVDLMLGVIREFGLNIAVRERPTAPEEVLALVRAHDGLDPFLDDGLFAAIVKAAVHNVRLIRRATPPAFSGSMWHFTATHDRRPGLPDGSAWSRFVRGDIASYPVPFTHDEMTRPEMLRRVGRALSGQGDA